MVGVIFVYVDTAYGFYGFFFMLSWMFQNVFLDTYCFQCLICMCFTWKGALEICSLLLLLLLLLLSLLLLLLILLLLLLLRLPVKTDIKEVRIS